MRIGVIPYKGIGDALRRIAREEGVRGLYRYLIFIISILSSSSSYYYYHYSI